MSLVRPDAETELYIGLVGAVGTDLGATARALKQIFGALEYKVCDVKMSDLIREVKGSTSTFEGHESWPEHRRIEEHMNAGDSIREQVEDGGALAAAAMTLVRQVRQNRRPKETCLHPELTQAPWGDKAPPVHLRRAVLRRLRV